MRQHRRLVSSDYGKVMPKHFHLAAYFQRLTVNVFVVFDEETIDHDFVFRAGSATV